MKNKNIFAVLGTICQSLFGRALVRNIVFFLTALFAMELFAGWYFNNSLVIPLAVLAMLVWFPISIYQGNVFIRFEEEDRKNTNLEVVPPTFVDKYVWFFISLLVNFTLATILSAIFVGTCLLLAVG